MGVGASGAGKGGRGESHMSGKVPQSPLCGTHHTSTWIWDHHTDMDHMGLTDMGQKNHPRSWVFWKDNSIERTKSGHVGEIPKIPLYITYHLSYFNLPGTTGIYLLL